MTSLFTKIIKQEIPSFKVFENDLVYVFLDIFPMAEGHLLIIPKIEIDKIYDLPDNYYQEIFKITKKMSPVLEKVFNSDRIVVTAEGLEIPHAHLHLIPLKNTPVSGLKKASKPIDESILKTFQKRILTELEKTI